MIELIKKLFKPIQLSIVLLSVTACVSQNAANVKATAETKLITDIITSEDAQSSIVTVTGNDTLAYTAIKQEYPLGLLLLFPGTALDNIKTVFYPPENGDLKSIRAMQLEDDELTSRIFIALKRDLSYSIKPDDARLDIYFSKTNGAADVDSAQDVAEEKVDIMPEPEPDIAPVLPATLITSVTATALKKNVVIGIKADGTINDYRSFTIAGDPSRIVYDLYGLKSPNKTEQSIAVKSDWVSGIRYYGHPEKVRMVLETKKAHLSKFSDSPTNDGLLIYVGDVPAPLTKDKAEPVVAQDLPSAKPKQNETSKDKVAQPTALTQNDKLAWLNRIDFASEEAGKSALIVGTTQPVDYQLIKISDKRLRLELLDTNLPEYRNRALITTRFQSAVDRITPTQQPETNDTVIVIELREAVPYLVKQNDRIIRVDFSASSIPPKPYEDGQIPAWKRVLTDPDVEPSTAPTARKATKAEQTERFGNKDLGKKHSSTQGKKALIVEEATEAKKLDLARQKKKDVYSGDEKQLDVNGDSYAKLYTGEPIALDFYDTDIKNVFRIIREISGKNIAIDKNVTGKVTLTLDKPAPWDQVLDLVLKMNDLGMKMEGDIIRITTLAKLAQEEILEAKQLEEAQKKKKQEDLITAFIPINYASAEEVAKQHIRPIYSSDRKDDGASVTVDTRLSLIIITDVPSVIKRAKEIIERIDLVTPQVIIEARIVEANSAFTRDLGFDWGSITAGPFSIGDADLTLTGLASNLPTTNPSAVVGGSFQKLTGTPFEIIDAKLVASETEGKTNIISAPKVVTLNNTKAMIKQGLEIPYLESDASGLNATVQFKDVDLLLEVTPSVTPDDRIGMEIFVTKNEVVDPTADQPALSINELTTKLLVENGDTIVVGGIVKSSIQYGEKGIPGMRQIGVLGWLFKGQSKSDSKNELMVFLTPRIVKLDQKKVDI
jgi:type IV pilus assembly protein PilQ